MEQVKLNFFQQIIYAITKPKQYYKLTKVSGGRLTGFVFLLMLVVTFFLSILPLTDTFNGAFSVFQMLEEDIPAFELKNGELYVSERYEDASNDIYVLIDTNVDKFDYNDIDQSYSQVILISRTNLFQYQAYGKTQELTFNQIPGLNINNSTLQSFKPFIYFIIIIGTLFYYLFKVGAYFFTALIYSLIGLIVASASKTNLSYGKIFKVAIYSKVTISLLYTLLEFANLSLLPSLAKNILAIVVTCIYVVFGILSHNSEEARMDDQFVTIQNNDNQNNY